MKKYTILLLLISSPIFNFLEAQEILHFDITNQTANSINYLMDCDSSHCYIALYESTPTYRVTSIVKMDVYGNEIHRLLDLSFDDYTIEFISHIYENDNKLIVFANANISEETEFITFSINKNLDSPQLIDKLPLGNNFLSTIGFEYNEESDQFETFGTTRGSLNNTNNGNFYLNVTAEGIFGPLEDINLNNAVSTITSFSNVGDGNTFLTLDPSNMVLLDGNFEIISNGILQYPLMENSVDSVQITPFYSATYNDKLVMIGVGDNANNFASNLSFIDILNDTLLIDSTFSITNPSLFERVQSINADLDKENNLVVVSVGNIDGGAQITENTLYVDKFDEELNSQWSVDINTIYELVPQRVHINEDATVYICGSYREASEFGIRKNFVIILSPEGEIITSNIDISLSDQAILYPNPTKGEVNIRGVDNLDQQYQLYDVNGMKVRDGILDQLTLSGLNKGMYTVIFNGVRKRVVLY